MVIAVTGGCAFLWKVNMPIKDLEIRKQKQKEYSRKHYQENAAAYKIASARSRRTFKKKWDKYKAEQKCIKCGFAHPAAIDFHHVVRNASNKKLHAIVKNYNFTAAMEEIKKCVPLCANCHRILHHTEHKASKLDRKKAKKRVTTTHISANLTRKE